MLEAGCPDQDCARHAILMAQVAAPGELDLAAVAERVAQAIAQAEPAPERSRRADRFAAMIASGDFLPSVPILSNAGRGGQLAACFALELEDSLESIYGSLHRAARIQQGSGGVGIELSALRPRGAPIARSGGRSPGPVAFAELFARSAHVMRMAGRRAGAHLAILRDDHPDLIEFVRARRDAPARFPQLGFAVGLSDALLQAARTAGTWTLRHERGDTREIDARGLMHELADAILASGNPTLLFVDRIQAENPTPGLGALRATNPCGEQPLLSGESCVLGSIQLPRFVDARGRLDEARLGEVVRDAIALLDDALEINVWPDAEIAAASRRTRKVGLGVMGWADLLLLRGLPYDGEDARELCRRILAGIAREADAASAALGETRGVYPAWQAGPRRRNATTRALAPTGTLSLIAGCSPGIEPFTFPQVEVVTETSTFVWTDEWLRRWLADRGLASPALFDACAEPVPSPGLSELGELERRLLRRAWEITPEAQIAMQAAAQGEVDGAVSKTVQLDASTGPTAQDVARWIELAHRLGCKGVAFYLHARPAVRTRIDLRAERGPAPFGTARV